MGIKNLWAPEELTLAAVRKPIDLQWNGLKPIGLVGMGCDIPAGTLCCGATQ